MTTDEQYTEGFTVKQLRDLLATMPDDLPVWMSKDPEGNGFGLLDEVDRALMTECGWTGDPEPVHPDDYKDYDIEDLKEAVILWP